MAQNEIKKADTLREPYTLSWLTAVYLIILLAAWGDHFFRFLNSTLAAGKVTHPLFCFIAGCCMIAVVGAVLFRRVRLHGINIRAVDSAVLVPGTLYFFLKLPFMDLSYDSQWYEFLTQQYPFENHLSDLFFMDKSYLYGLGERVFFYFRMLLGVRGSLIINYLVYVVSYFSIKEIVTWFARESGLELDYTVREITVKGSVIPLLSAMILLCEFFVAGMYVMKPDLFIVPLLLEAVRIFFCKKRLSAGDFVYLGILFGLSIAVKLTFLFALVPLFAVGGILHYREITVKRVICGMVPVLVLLSIYVIYAWSSVGDPLYPYYNWIFKGGYAPVEPYAWDGRWGPKNIVQVLFWPLINFYNPRYRYVELGWCSGRLAVGYLAAIGLCAAALFTKKLRKLFPIGIALLLDVVLWAKTAGYARYAIGIEIFAGVFVAALLFSLTALYRESHVKYIRWSVMGIALLFTLQFLYAQGIITYINLDWRTDNNHSIFTYDVGRRRNKFINVYKKHAKLLFRDRGNPVGSNAGEIRRELAKVDLWIDGYNTLYEVLLQPKARIFVDNIVFPAALKEKQLANLYATCDTERIYGIASSPNGPEYAVDFFNRKGFYIEKTFTFQVDFLPPDQQVTMYKLNTLKVLCAERIADHSVEPLHADSTLRLTPQRGKQLFDYYSYGISGQESDGIWTVKKMAEMPLSLSGIGEKGTLELTLEPFGQQRVIFSIGDTPAGEVRLENGEEKVALPFTKELCSPDGVLILKMKLPDATQSPFSLHLSDDNRLLGVQLRALTVTYNK